MTGAPGQQANKKESGELRLLARRDCTETPRMEAKQLDFRRFCYP